MVQVRSSRSYSGLPGGGFVTRADTAFDYGQAFQTVLESTEPLLRILDDNRQRALRSFEFDREQTLKRFDLDFVRETEQTNRFIAGLEYEQKKRDVQFEQFLRIQDLMEKRRDQDEALKARELQRKRDNEKYELMQRGMDLMAQYYGSQSSYDRYRLFGRSGHEYDMNRRALIAVDPEQAGVIFSAMSTQSVRFEDGTEVPASDAFRRLEANPDSVEYHDQRLRDALIKQDLIKPTDDLSELYPGGFGEMERLTQVYTHGTRGIREVMAQLRAKDVERRNYLAELKRFDIDPASDPTAVQLLDEIKELQDQHKNLLSATNPARIETGAALVKTINGIHTKARTAPLTDADREALGTAAAALAKMTSEDKVVAALLIGDPVSTAALETLAVTGALDEPAQGALRTLEQSGITLPARDASEAIAARLAGAIPQGDVAKFVTVVDQLTNAARLSDNLEHRDLLNGAAAALIRQIPVSDAFGGEGVIEPTTPAASLETTSGIVRGVLSEGRGYNAELDIALTAGPPVGLFGDVYGLKARAREGDKARRRFSGDAVKAAQEIEALGGPEAALAHFINNRGVGDMPLEIARSMFADLAQGKAPASAAGRYSSFKSTWTLGRGWGYLSGSRARQAAESEAASSIVSALRSGVTNNFQNHTVDTLASEVRNFQRLAKDPTAGPAPANQLLTKATDALSGARPAGGSPALTPAELATLWAITGRSDFIVLQGASRNRPLRVVPITVAERLRTRRPAGSASDESADAPDGATPPPAE